MIFQVKESLAYERKKGATFSSKEVCANPPTTNPPMLKKLCGDLLSIVFLNTSQKHFEFNFRIISLSRAGLKFKPQTIPIPLVAASHTVVPRKLFEIYR